jgi:hypothetical protein
MCRVDPDRLQKVGHLLLRPRRPVVVIIGIIVIIVVIVVIVINP